MSLEDVLNELENLIIDAQRVPFSSKRLIEEDELGDIVDALKSVIPEEIKKAKSLLVERNKMLADAKLESEDIIEKTKDYARTLVKDQEIYLMAKKEAEELIENTNSQAEEILLQAREEAMQIVANAKEEAEERLLSAEAHSDKMKNEAREYVFEMLEYMQKTTELARENNQQILEALAATQEKYIK